MVEAGLTDGSRDSGMVTLSRLIALVAALFAIYLGLPLQTWLPPQEARAAALAIFAIGLWATGILPGHLTTLAFFLLAMVFAVAPASVIFSGFESAAIWLIFGGLVIGEAVKRTGLGARIATRVARNFSSSYVNIIAGIVAISVALGFLMPSSMGRLIILIPITSALADHFGFSKGSNGRTGMILATAFGTHLPAFAILPANLPNMILIGAAETLYGITPQYGEYLLLHFPVLGILKSLFIVALIVWLYPAHLQNVNHFGTENKGMSSDERHLTIILVLSLGMWITDFAHHISPAWIALGAALTLLLPRFGIVPSRAFNEDINYSMLFYVAGIMGLSAMVAQSGLGNFLANALLSALAVKQGAALKNFASLTAVATLIGAATTLPGVPAILTPLAEKMADASGLPIKTVLMTQVLGFSTQLLPYQGPPLIVAMQLGGEPITAASKLCLTLAIVTITVLWPIDFIWWKLLGWI